MIFHTRLQKTKQEVAKAPFPSHPLAVLPVRRLKVVRDLDPDFDPYMWSNLNYFPFTFKKSRQSRCHNIRYRPDAINVPASPISLVSKGFFLRCQGAICFISLLKPSIN